MSKISVYIVDDHQVVREGLSILLIGESDIEVKEMLADAESLLKVLKNEIPDVLLLDIGLPDINGIELAQKLKGLHPSLPVLIISANIDDYHLVEAVKAGVKGFLTKDIDKIELSKAIRLVAGGDKYFSPELSQNLQAALINHFETVELTEREKETALLLAKGLSFREIGEQLFISERTVETHKNNALKKLGLRNTLQLVAWTVKNLQ